MYIPSAAVKGEQNVKGVIKRALSASVCSSMKLPAKGKCNDCKKESEENKKNKPTMLFMFGPMLNLTSFAAVRDTGALAADEL